MARLKDHRKQVRKANQQSHTELRALHHDRTLHPRASHNQRGELIFDLDEAKLLLREDVKNKVHLGMTPRELHNSRPEYLRFKGKIFRQRIYQEVRRQKFIHYLELQREKEKKKQEKKNKTRN